MTSSFLHSALLPGVGCSWQTPTEPRLKLYTLKCQARSDDFERKLSTRFVIPEQILESNNETPAEQSGLLSLPAEVILHIFDSIAHSPSQVAFALTCKQIGTLATKTDLNLSTASPKYAGFLPVSVFDVPDLMAHLRSWMPPHLRLCGHCLTYRPFATEYWQYVPGYEGSDLWIRKIGWAFKDAGWRKLIHDICPACHFDCTLSDYVPCDGCRALGRLGDVDWTRVSDSWRPRPDVALSAVDGLTRA